LIKGGVFGSLMSTPIINPPQAGKESFVYLGYTIIDIGLAVLGLHAIFNRAVPIDGKIEVRPVGL
jgi:2-oxoglutarate dehydrogenase E2 component (dihydrolipoamide succinyltransferase)